MSGELIKLELLHGLSASINQSSCGLHNISVQTNILISSFMCQGGCFAQCIEILKVDENGTEMGSE